VHWSRIDDVLKQAGDVSGKVIVSCSLPMNADDTDLVIAHTSSGAEALAKKVPKARVVSAFGTVPSESAVWRLRGSAQGHEAQSCLLRGRCEQQEDCR
jgi:predicted dinucleotide-binding enzyme